MSTVPAEFDVVEDEDFDVIRTKRFSVKPMTTDEAILQMNLLGHSFYVFRNIDNNTVCVVYQRNNVTNDVLYKEGLDLLVVPSAELSRGRGGPRCMSMPFWREDL